MSRSLHGCAGRVCQPRDARQTRAAQEPDCQGVEHQRQDPHPRNTNDKTHTRWLDRIKVYDEQGRVIEETEYATYGQKWRVTYEYTDSIGGKVLKEVEYNDKNKPYRIRKYEYNTNGTKAKQYNYLPNGKLESVKVFEYIFQK